MKRTFIAFDITPSEAVKEVFETVRHKLRNERISWTDPDRLHITLKFLGDTTEEKIPSIVSAVNATVRPYDPFRVILTGLGVFRNIHDPHVIWMGCRIENSLVTFKQELEAAIGALGFEVEKRTFSPHLTLGRIKLIRQTNHLSEILTAYKEKVFQEFMVTDLIYYESRLTPSGSVYTPIDKFTID
ncbi:MAG TPA: RNA 2',3'-cyclic phosphodiesterase, partial [Bacteroidales bacterium]|nr:RNA 2',3'-cyclic phosphodiesterase [Bacteroidales bacterium]